MNKLKKLMIQRRSKRNYNGQAVKEEDLQEIIEAGLLAPTGRNLLPTEIIVVKERDMLEKLSHAKTAGSALLKGAAAAIVVVGDCQKSDTWIEDGAIMMAYMQLMAENLGVGNCWVQIRNRDAQKMELESAVSSQQYVRAALHIPEQFGILAILALGMSDEIRAPHTAEDLDEGRRHKEVF